MARKKRGDGAFDSEREVSRTRHEKHRADGESQLGAREKLRVDGEIKLRENRYYRIVSERYRLAGFALFLAFTVFCGVILVRYSDYISYDNFVYLIRDLDLRESQSETHAELLRLNIDDGAVIRPFRDGFAVAEHDALTVYDSAGRQLLSESESFSYPALAVSDKYIIAYDIGGKSFSVYNSVTRIVTKKTESPIVCASVCDSGTFTVTTESTDAKYVTEMYNTALQNTCHFYSRKYVISAAVAEGGDMIASVALAENGTDYACEVSFARTSDTEPYKTLMYSMSLPLELSLLDDGGFVLVCDDAVRFFSSDGEPTAEHVVDGTGISCFDTESWGVLLVCRENSLGTKNKVYALDTKGNIIHEYRLDSRVDSARIARDGGAFVGYLTDKRNALVLLADGSVRIKSHDAELSSVIELSGEPYALIGSVAHRLDLDAEVGE